MKGNADMPVQRNGHFRITVHTMHCNAALLQPCMTHYRVAASLLCGFMSSLHLVSPA